MKGVVFTGFVEMMEGDIGVLKTQALLDSLELEHNAAYTAVGDYPFQELLMILTAFSEDGSLRLYIQNESPGEALDANWLTAPDGPFYLIMRLYGPEEAALSGEWVNPEIVTSN